MEIRKIPNKALGKIEKGVQGLETGINRIRKNSE